MPRLQESGILSTNVSVLPRGYETKTDILAFISCLFKSAVYTDVANLLLIRSLFEKFSKRAGPELIKIDM